VRNGAAGAQAVQGDVPGEPGALSLLHAEVAVDDERAGRALRAPVPRVRQCQAQHLRGAGAHPNPRRFQGDQVPHFVSLPLLFFIILVYDVLQRLVDFVPCGGFDVGLFRAPSNYGTL
jgi:hypothetical protein